MARSIGEVMAEGQRLTLELVDLKRKEIAGTATADEKARIIQLDAYLLGLVGEAQAQGVGTAVGTGYGEVQADEDEDEGYDEYDDDLSLDLDEEDEVQAEEPKRDNIIFGGGGWFR